MTAWWLRINGLLFVTLSLVWPWRLYWWLPLLVAVLLLGDAIRLLSCALRRGEIRG